MYNILFYDKTFHYLSLSDMLNILFRLFFSTLDIEFEGSLQDELWIIRFEIFQKLLNAHMLARTAHRLYSRTL